MAELQSVNGALMGYSETPDTWGNKAPGCACEVRPIKQRMAYQIGINLYRTPQGAAKKLAWSWILTKYACYGKLQDIGVLYKMRCDCATDDTDLLSGEACEIHDRKTGYFHRLHERAVIAILAQWKREGLI